MSSEEMQAASFLLNLKDESTMIMLPPIQSLLPGPTPCQPSHSLLLHDPQPKHPYPGPCVPSTSPSSSVMDIHTITHATDQDPLRRSAASINPRKAAAAAAAAANSQSSLRSSGRRHQRRPSSTSGSFHTDQAVRPRRTTITSTTGSSTSSTSSSAARTPSKGGTIRPRWQAHERLKLFLAVIEDKQLDDMSTFRWGPVAKKVGRSRKACKDQWRREVLRSVVQHLQSQAAHEPAEHEDAVSDHGDYDDDDAEEAEDEDDEDEDDDDDDDDPRAQ